MKYLVLIASGVNFVALFFLVFATVYSSRPKKAKRRAIEFGGYFIFICLCSAFGIPPATAEALDPGKDAVISILSVCRTLVSALSLYRIGGIIIGHYGQRIALERYIASMQPHKGEAISDD